ncbi:MAG: hypothetical protein ACRDT8_09375 [Micromonosporaceae bacterium]
MDNSEILSRRLPVCAIARGSAEQLKLQIGGERLEVTVETDEELATTMSVLAAIGSADPISDPQERSAAVAVASGVPALVEAVRKLDASGITPSDIGIRRPTLDDVFLRLTGHAAGEPGAGDEDATPASDAKTGDTDINTNQKSGAPA